MKSKRKIYLILIASFAGLLAIIIFLYLVFYRNNNLEEPIAKTITWATLNNVPKIISTPTSHSGSTELEQTENILDEWFRVLWWENYLYDNKFQKLIFAIGIKSNYEDISKILLYNPCFATNNVTYSCENNMLLKFLLHPDNKALYTISSKGDKYTIINNENRNKIRIIETKDHQIFILLLK